MLSVALLRLNITGLTINTYGQGLKKNNNNNNNNYYIMGPLRFNPERSPLGEGFFPDSRGSKGLANLPTPALPYPSYPALYRQDTTYAWRPAFE